MLLHNCYLELSKNRMFDSRAQKLVKDLQVYIKSRNKSVSFNAQCLLLNLSPFLTEDNRRLLALSSSSTTEILCAMEQAVLSPLLNITLSCGVSLSLLECVNLLRDAACLKENIESMVQNNRILQIMTALIKHADIKIIESTLLLMWSMSMYKDINQLLKKDSDLAAELRVCPCKLSKTVLLSIYLETVNGKLYFKCIYVRHHNCTSLYEVFIFCANT